MDYHTYSAWAVLAKPNLPGFQIIARTLTAAKLYNIAVRFTIKLTLGGEVRNDIGGIR